MGLLRNQVPQPLELVSLFLADPADLLVGRRRSEHDHPVDEVGAASRQGQRHAPSRRPTNDAHALDGRQSRTPARSSAAVATVAHSPAASGGEPPYPGRSTEMSRTPLARVAVGSGRSHRLRARCGRERRCGPWHSWSCDGLQPGGPTGERRAQEQPIAIPATFCRVHHIDSARARKPARLVPDDPSDARAADRGGASRAAGGLRANSAARRTGTR